MRFILSLFLLFPLCLSAQDTTRIILEGKYQGQDLYVQNPVRLGGFCIEKILINKTEYSFEPSAALAIELKGLNFKIGDSLRVEIFHHNDCAPKILQPFHVTPISTFNIKEMNVTAEGLLTWTTENESNKLPYTIEQYMWNKWVKVGEVEGKGSANHNEYSFQLIPHSGENKVRVNQILNGRPNVSPAKNFTFNKEEISYQLDAKKRLITFSDETHYELHDEGGNVLKKGYGKEIQFNDSKYKRYYLNYDNQSAILILKTKKSHICPVKFD